jgi:molybdenum cofactor cytidylyltransferase
MMIVILAAGAAERMGRQKLLLPIDGRPMLQHVLDRAAAWPVVVVSGHEVAPTLGSTPFRIVRNDAPERGMSHSLRLGNAVVPDELPIAVLLGDLPDMTADSIGAVLGAYDDSVDVVLGRCGETLVHPVVFGPRARRMIADLPDGDTIKRLRDNDQLRRRIVDVDRGALTDIDTPADYHRRTQQNGDPVKMP